MRRSWIVITFAAAVAAGVWAADAARADVPGLAFQPPIDIGGRSSIVYEHPDIEKLPGGGLGIVWIESVRRVWYAESSDGAAWSAPVQVNDSINGERFSTRLRAAPNGTRHVVKQDYRRLGSTDQELYATRSLDGLSWSTNQPVYGSLSGDQDLDRGLLVTSDGTVWVVYEDDRLGRYDRTALWVQKSTDDGATFGASVRIDPFTSGHVVGHCVQEDTNGDLVVVFGYSTTTSRHAIDPDVYVTRSSDGVAWSTPVRINSFTGDTGTGIGLNNIDLAIDDDGGLHAVWVDRRNGDLDIWYSYSGDHGSTWSSEVELADPDDGDQSNANLRCEDGVLYLGWLDGSDDAVRLRISCDLGATWGASLRADDETPGRGAYMDMEVDGGAVYFAWAQDAGNGWQVRFLRSDAAPVAVLAADATYECTDRMGRSVTLSAEGSYDPEGAELSYAWTVDGVAAVATTATLTRIYALGEHTVSVVVNDGGQDSVPAQVTFEVVDTTPPDVDVADVPTELWPPNHKLVRIEPALDVFDLCDASPHVAVTVTSSEPEDAQGDGSTEPDIVIHSPTDIELRAERSGSGDGRTYTLVWTATDASGNSTTSTATVRVPKSKGK